MAAYRKLIENNPVLGEIYEWTNQGSEHNIWHGGDVGESGNAWQTCLDDCQLDGWFTADQLRAIAEKIK
jgi:hypothetical protein